MLNDEGRNIGVLAGFVHFIYHSAPRATLCPSIQREALLNRAASLAPHWQEAAHALRGLPHVIDIRNYGSILGLEHEPLPGKPGTRGLEVFTRCFERGVLVRQTGDVIALSPALIIEKAQIEQIFGTLCEVLSAQ
jgi:beta-alanine--pyruvate transaminase